MKSLHRQMKRGVSAGEPLPSPWPIWDEHKMHLRRGSVAMIAGPPGSMKTVKTMNIVRNINVPTIYHSNDSDDFTMASRSLAMLTGETTDQTEQWVMEQKQQAYEQLKKMNNVRWTFQSNPSIEDFWAEAEAFREFKGEYPHLTVVDILMNVENEGAGEQQYWGVMADLNDMARAQETAVLVVHHTSESAKAGSPPPRSAIMGKANHLPTLIVTLWGNAYDGTLDVATVKNRFGPQDPMAKKSFRMKADPAICLIEEEEQDSVLFNDGPSVPDNLKVDVWKDGELV